MASKINHINQKFHITNNASSSVHTLTEQNVEEQDINKTDKEIIDKNYIGDKVQNGIKKDQDKFNHETSKSINIASTHKTDIEKNSLNCLRKKPKLKKKIWNLQNDSNSPKKTSDNTRNVVNELPNCSKRVTESKPQLKYASILDEQHELVVQKRSKLKLSGRKLLANRKIVRSSSVNYEEQRKSMFNELAKNVEKKKLPKTEKGVKKIENKEGIAKEKKKVSCNVLAKLSPKRLTGKMCTNETVSLGAIKVEEGKCCTDKANIEAKNICNVSNAIVSIDNQQELEIADDVVSLSGLNLTEKDLNKSTKKAIVGLLAHDRISVCGQEELPIVESQIRVDNSLTCKSTLEREMLKESCIEDTFVIPITEIVSESYKETVKVDEIDGHDNSLPPSEVKVEKQQLQLISDRSKQHKLAISKIIVNLVPKRKTSDGTSIYYWCNMPKKVLKG